MSGRSGCPPTSPSAASCRARSRGSCSRRPTRSTTAPVSTGALEQMVSEFTDNARSTNFTAQAKALGLTPYQELIIASIAQSEAKFPQDMPKVARVILNRIKAGRNLQIDATSAYAAKLRGLDPTKTIYSPGPGAVQHLQPRRPAADADQQPGRRRHAGRRAPGDGQLAVLRQRRRRRAPVLHQQPDRVRQGRGQVQGAGLGLRRRTRRRPRAAGGALAVAGAAPRCVRRARLDWRYDAIDCGVDELAAVLAARADWAGFSCTMPLKHAALEVAAEVRPLAVAVGCGEHARARSGRVGRRQHRRRRDRRRPA